MTRTELIEKVAKSAKMSKKDAAAAMGAMFDAITDALAHDDTVRFIGFGSFEVRSRATYLGRYPKDPTRTFRVPAKKFLLFRPGKNLREKVLAVKP